MRSTTPMPLCLTLIAILLLGRGPADSAWCNATRLPAYPVRRASSPVSLDGNLGDAAWRFAQPITAFHCFGPKRGRPSLPTTARLLWDEDYLYVAFRCRDTDVWSTRRERDTELWEGEVVEIYVDADGDGRNYKELEVNPLNAVIDLNIVEPKDGNPGDWKPQASWNSAGWRTAVSIDGTVDNREDTDTGWCCEMAIPLSDLTAEPVRPGTRWRAQLLRIERANTLAEPEYSAWSPTDTFHRPERFGVLVFVGR